MGNFHHPNMTESEWNAMKELETKIMREFDEKLKLNKFNKKLIKKKIKEIYSLLTEILED